ncbi:MAG: hypothetical protein NVSMB24_34170 [Mucilaginibacter sp.]
MISVHECFPQAKFTDSIGYKLKWAEEFNYEGVPDGTVIAAVVHCGRGIVFTVGDLWFYNEYVNDRLPAGYENDKAASDLAGWLTNQAVKKHKH